MPEKPSQKGRKPKTGSRPRKPQQGGGKPSGRKPQSRKPQRRKPQDRKPQDRELTPRQQTTKPKRAPQPGRVKRTPRRHHKLQPTKVRRRAYHLVVNQASGPSPEISVKLAKKLERRLKRANWETVLHLASTWEEFVQAVIKALRDRPYTLVVFGGDGSVRMAASRVARAKGLLGIVPCGKYNNIFESLYGHTSPEEAMDIVRSEHQMRIDAGLANGNFFLGSLITGLLPVMIANQGNKKLPRLAMTWSKIAGRAADDTMPRTITLKVDTYTFKVQPLVLNIQLLSHLMSLRFAPVATPDDGRAVVIFDREGTRDSVAHYIRDLKKDRYQYSDDLQILRGQRISMSPAAGRKWLIDGDEIEFAGEAIVIEVLPRILRVFSNAKPGN